MRFILFFLLLISSLTVSAATFIVTSNADSGPGTLRQALTDAAANGSAETDYINFNIADVSEAGRTIKVLSKLPDISSHIVIDGTTQTGTTFGVGDSKVKIQLSYYELVATVNLFFISQQTNVEIYGLFFNGDVTLYSHDSSFYGIYATSSSNLIIGAPGKGNRFENLTHAINADSRLQYQGDQYIGTNIKVSSNVAGIHADGTTADQPCGMIFDAIRDLTFGGSTRQEGNIVYGLCMFGEDNRYRYTNRTGKLYVSNNMFGTNYSGTGAIVTSLAMGSLAIEGFFLDECDFSNNVVAASMSVFVNCFFTLHGNKFGTDITGTKVINNKSSALVLGYCGGGGIVGGPNPEDGNIFSGYSYQLPQESLYGVVLNIGSHHVELLNNIFRCNYTTYVYQVTGDNSVPGYSTDDYYTTINSRGTDNISGTATPNSRVDLYYSLSCDNCEPEKLLQSTNADANGKWHYTGTLLNNNIVATSTFNGTTSEFTTLHFVNSSNDVIVKLACNSQKGSITGLKVNTTANYTWYDENNNIISHNIDLIDAPVGKYHLIVDNNYCSIASAVYEIKDASNQIDDSNIKIQKSSCNNQTGSITGLLASSGSSFIWKDQTGNIKSNSIDLYFAASGNYTLYVTTPGVTCTQTYGPITISNTTGPSLDQTKVSITPSLCGQAKGSITNIIATGTGTLKYSWKDEQNQEVATTKDLINQPAGKYMLVVTDETACGGVLSTPIEIPEVNGITFDGSQIQINAATCRGADGSISKLTAANAATYNWYDANNHLVGTAANLTNAAPGTYHLVASNGTCSKTSNNYTINQLTNTTIYTALNESIVSATCGLNNGSVTVNFGNANMPKAYRWQNDNGDTVGGNSTSLENLNVGGYKLFLTDENGCEKLYKTYTVFRVIGLDVNTDNLKVTNEHCDDHKGSITGIRAGGEGSLNFKWTNANGDVISTAPDLINLYSGNYHLTVTDNTCRQDFDYTIINETDNVQAPEAVNLQLCSAGDAILTLNNISAQYAYRLYNNSTDLKPIDDQKSGRFNINVTANRSYYVSQYYGECESARTEIQVSVGVSKTNIPNVITPNGDGINDTWDLKDIQSYPSAQVQIYNRNGQKVFESKGYSIPFDGTYNGTALPTGTYYYIVNLSANCNLLSGSLTIIR